MPPVRFFRGSYPCLSGLMGSAMLTQKGPAAAGFPMASKAGINNTVINLFISILLLSIRRSSLPFRGCNHVAFGVKPHQLS